MGEVSPFRLLGEITEGGGGVSGYRALKYGIKGRGHLNTFMQPKLFCGYRPHLLIDFDEMLYGSLYNIL